MLSVRLDKRFRNQFYIETMAAVRSAVLNLIPKRTLSGPLRRSEGGIALIQRTNASRRQWLAQWNDNWKAFFFIGGHREESESYCECVVRELDEALGLTEIECHVIANVGHHLEYKARSQSASEISAYTMELFDAQPTSAGMAKIALDPMNK
jgi:8-oxo-dGTP pyrophosphatase MutT (NUDIX family)